MYNQVIPLGETVTSQLSPSSLNEDSSGESRPDKPRLQRSMGQSKKTFRLRKSRRAHVEVSQTKPEQYEVTSFVSIITSTTPTTPIPIPIPIATTTTSPPVSTPVSTPAMELSTFSILSDSSSIRSRRSSSIRQSDSEKGSIPIDQQQGHQLLHHHHHHHHLHPQTSDISWDEDTSSTSGYRESCSIQLVSLDSSNNNARSAHAPPLASPDLNDMPSTSSTTTNFMGFDGSSPDSSINGSGGERIAMLTIRQRSSSQHCLVTVSPNQDEDTLI